MSNRKSTHEVQYHGIRLIKSGLNYGSKREAVFFNNVDSADSEVPGRPRNVKAYAVSSEQIELTWEPPANAAAVRIQGYAVR